jgi:hypothetical protein
LSQMEPGGGLAQGRGALFDGGVGPNPTLSANSNYQNIKLGLWACEVRTKFRSCCGLSLASSAAGPQAGFSQRHPSRLGNRVGCPASLPIEFIWGRRRRNGLQILAKAAPVVSGQDDVVCVDLIPAALEPHSGCWTPTPILACEKEKIGRRRELNR